MRQLMVVVGVLVLAAGITVFVLQSRGGGAGSSTTTSDTNIPEGGADTAVPSFIPETDIEAYTELREELDRATPVAFRSDAERIAEARAWVDANRPADRPYNELEAKMLAMMDMFFDGQKRSVLWMLNNQEIEVEMIRAIDADGDGQVSEEEVEAFAAEGFAMFNPMEHPYLKDKFDTDGDGELNQSEMQAFADKAMGMGDGAMAGVMERAKLEAWDSDGDGFLSDSERADGEAKRSSLLKFSADGQVQMVTDPSEIDPAEQEQVMAELAENFGEDYVKQIRAQNEMMSSMAIAMPLLQDMRIENMNQQELQARMMENMPTPPMQGTFDADGDGTVNAEESQAYMDAMQSYQETMQDWAAVQMASSLRLMFEHAASQSDQDGDGRMSSEEWDDRIGQLTEERDNRLFLRSYDLDGSGRIDGEELSRYVEWYQRSSPRADINYDGSVDARDLEQMSVWYQQQWR